MHKITRKHRSGHKEYTVYTQEEADEEGIDYVHWKDVQEGGWAITDDGYVMECFRRYDYDNGSQIKLAGGSSWANEYSEINHDEYREVGNYSYNRPQTWDEVEARKTRTSRAIHILASSLVATGKYDWDAAAAAYRPDEEIPEASLRRLLRKDEIKMKLDEELVRIYENKNFTKSAVIDDLVEARKLAKDKKDLSNLNRAIETSIKLLAMEPDKSKHVDEIEMDFSKEIANGIQKEKGSLKARRTTGEDEDDNMEVEQPEDEQSE